MIWNWRAGLFFVRVEEPLLGFYTEALSLGFTCITEFGITGSTGQKTSLIAILEMLDLLTFHCCLSLKV